MFQKPFSFEGRIRRTEYGISYLITMAASIVVNMVALTGKSAAIVYLAYIPLCWFLWAQGAKRCHDRGNTGWFQIIPFYILWMFFAAGDVGLNEYGADPKGIAGITPAPESITTDV